MDDGPVPGSTCQRIGNPIPGSASQRIATAFPGIPSHFNNIIMYGSIVQDMYVHVLVIAIGFNLSARHRRRRSLARNAEENRGNAAARGIDIGGLVSLFDEHLSAATHSDAPMPPAHPFSGWLLPSSLTHLPFVLLPRRA